jgi:hypothetical protein
MDRDGKAAKREGKSEDLPEQKFNLRGYEAYLMILRIKKGHPRIDIISVRGFLFPLILTV